MPVYRFTGLPVYPFPIAFIRQAATATPEMRIMAIAAR
jgi:hypothetical protein